MTPRAFTFKRNGRSVLVIEQLFDKDRSMVPTGYTLIENSFLLN